MNRSIYRLLLVVIIVLGYFSCCCAKTTIEISLVATRGCHLNWNEISQKFPSSITVDGQEGDFYGYIAKVLKDGESTPLNLGDIIRGDYTIKKNEIPNIEELDVVRISIYPYYDFGGEVKTIPNYYGYHLELFSLDFPPSKPLGVQGGVQ